ncbi:DUF1738 domain-containing protein [Lichenibacterium minor]|uniref:DUF1738 domain-containing protein n=1 Tax=Lichenibacterium minor TaxID=2316528 RepID=A0A4Q2U018_9HYPH|nr:ArdC-like ssDNA-binding domain-containing protein [Lichenibacterium minor]RYC29390.1 DUF1738 domain-containing protein [Lichenibacterium minor]
MEQNRNRVPARSSLPTPAGASHRSLVEGDGGPAAREASERDTHGGRGTLYAEITAKIIAELEAGRVPWVQPWTGSGGVPTMPTNAATGRRYSGINVLMLWAAAVERGYSSGRWLTFRQALALGGNVRKGERATMVVYVDRFVPEDERRRAADAGEETRTTAFLKQFQVFGVEQCDGLADSALGTAAVVEPTPMEPWMDALITGMQVDVQVAGDRARYHRLVDRIDVPPPSAYPEPVNWYRTVLHELAHATGHKDRLARDLTGWFGSAAYAREELIAEMTAAFLCAALWTAPTVRHADYIGSWLAVLRADERAIVRAASAASRAADYMTGFLPADMRGEPSS